MRELPEDTLYDIRLIERHIKEGLITEEDVKTHLAKLGDGEENSETFNVEELGQPAAS